MLGIYVHIPFCRRKCGYCDFVSAPNRDDLSGIYHKKLCDEAMRRAGEAEGAQVSSIYVGGGTPTLFSSESLGELLDVVRSAYTLAPDVEITVEANPETVDERKLAELRDEGFNRISFGFQSLDDEILSLLGRGHSASQAVAALKAANECGFERISVDLIYGIPGQSLASWARTLARAASLNPEHVSTYSLSIEEGTPFARSVDEGSMNRPDDDVAAEMFEHTIDFLTGEGYEHYEISNFAKPGGRSLHNLLYWDGEDYIGLGAAAHSKIGNRRFKNTDDVDAYIFGDCPENDNELSRKELVSEAFFLGLRKTEGLDLGRLAERFGKQTIDRYRRTIDELISDGLLSRTSSRIRLTRRGILLGNEVFGRFV